MGEIDDFWRYIMKAPKGDKAKFALRSVKSGRWARFDIYPRGEPRAPRPAMKAPKDREGRFAGAGVFGCLNNKRLFDHGAWLYLGAIELGTHELKVAGERMLVRQHETRAELTRTLEWLIARLKAGEWPLSRAELWHLGLCQGCYKQCSDPAKAPPYPECEACREKREEASSNVVRLRRPARDWIDDDIP
jgi:hypothetical protein